MAKLTKSFKTDEIPFNATMLKVGEMMECTGESYRGHILLRCTSALISLNAYNRWDNIPILTGRKLLPGEFVTLTQE